MLLILLMLVQDVPSSDDEVVVPARLYAQPACHPERGEIAVCGAQQRAAQRYQRVVDAKPDPMFADKRPRIHLFKGWCLRVGFMVNPERC
jgi:hypothetical protein